MDRLDLRTQVIPSHAKRHILHIEDDPEVAGSIGQLLESNGYEVTHAPTGFQDSLLSIKAPISGPQCWLILTCRTFRAIPC